MQSSTQFSVCLLLAVGTVPLMAAERVTLADLSQALQTCAAESDPTQRLACFDAAAARVPKAEPSKTPEQRFGYRGEVAREERQREREQEAAQQLDSLRSKVKSIAVRPLGQRVFTLENGQVWEQRSPDSRFNLDVGEEATIKSAALGSFLLVSPRGGSTRVSRVR